MLFTILYKLNLTKSEMVRHKACKVLPNLTEQVNVSTLRCCIRFIILYVYELNNI